MGNCCCRRGPREPALARPVRDDPDALEAFRRMWQERWHSLTESVPHLDLDLFDFGGDQRPATVFRAVLRLYAHHDDVIRELYDLNDRHPDDLAALVPQLCNFLLHGAYDKAPRLECFVLDGCGGSLEFAHRVVWFLRAFGNGGAEYHSEGLSAVAGDVESSALIDAVEQQGSLAAGRLHQAQGPGERRPSADATATAPAAAPPEPEPAELFQAALALVDDLTTVADQLRLAPPARRNEALGRELERMEAAYLPSKVLYVPLSNAKHRIVRIHAAESFTFSTKERVPYLVCLEVVDYAHEGAPPPRADKGFSVHMRLPFGFHIGSSSSDDEDDDEPDVAEEAAEAAQLPPPLTPTSMGQWARAQRAARRRSRPRRRTRSSSGARRLEAPPALQVADEEEGEEEEKAAPERRRRPSRRSSRRRSSGAPQPQPQPDAGRDTESELESELDRHVFDQATAPDSPAAGAVAAREPPEAPPLVFRERWADKEARLRAQSEFGHLRGWRLLPVIVKANDDLRQEQLASQLLAKFRDIFREAELPLFLRPYDIVATSPRTGLIEAVPDTVSLDSLKRNDPNYSTLRDFFERFFGPAGSRRHKRALRAFTESMAAYSIVCYLLQIKDRHNGNILLDAAGHILHIDFGFLLNSSPGNANFENVPFKLTNEFVDVMGGPRSATFRRFRALCVRGFLAARKRSEEVVLLVEMLASGNQDLPCFNGRPRAAIDALRGRFRQDLGSRAANDFVNGLIDSSAGAWRTRWYDRFQRIFVGYL